MLLKNYVASACVLLGATAMMAYAAEETAKPFKATCPVSGQPAVENKTVDYKGGKVYFCCGDCAAAFGKDTAKFATKANLQLAATGQAIQTKCPLTGGKLNPDANVEIAGVKVGFCCNKCEAKASETKGDAQMNLAFSDEAFAKAFEVKKP